MTKIMKAMKSAPERPSAKDFHVPADTFEFTEKHLQTHLSIFNKDTQPEYFTDFEHKGVTYVRTQRVHKDMLMKAKADTYGNQKYRPTKNKKYRAINKSVDTEGIDLRKKPIQVVATLDENNKIVSIDYLFNGNTLNSVLDERVIENRLCAIFIKNSNWSISNLIEIGANQNSLEKPFGVNDDNTIEHCCKEIIAVDGYPLDVDASKDEISDWVTSFKKAISFMCNGDDMDSAKVNTIVNSILDEKLDKTVARTIANGKTALEYLKTSGYVNTPTVKYGCIAAHFKGVHPHFANVYNDNEKVKGTHDYFDFNKGHYEVVIHGGAPEMSNPVSWFFDTFLTFWERYNKLVNFTSPNGFVNNVNMKIIGAYQPLEALDHIWPMDSVVSFEDIVEHFNKNASNLTLSQKIEEEETSTLDNWEEFQVAA